MMFKSLPFETLHFECITDDYYQNMVRYIEP